MTKEGGVFPVAIAVWNQHWFARKWCHHPPGLVESASGAFRRSAGPVGPRAAIVVPFDSLASAGGTGESPSTEVASGDHEQKGREPSAERLAWCDWTILVTNVPVELMTPEEVVVLYRARWQVELLFNLNRGG
jgi:hypothetical protein